MRKSIHTINGVFIAGILFTGLSVISAPALADATSSMDNLMLASADFKGSHPGKTHLAYERQSEKVQATSVEHSATVYRGKPPFRHSYTVSHQPLEKVQFARFEESSDATPHKHSIYRGSQGLRPPYKRNW